MRREQYLTIAPDTAATGAAGAEDAGTGTPGGGGLRILDEAGFTKAAEDAKAGCPVSKALTGVEITLDAALES